MTMPNANKYRFEQEEKPSCFMGASPVLSPSNGQLQTENMHTLHTTEVN